MNIALHPDAIFKAMAAKFAAADADFTTRAAALLAAHEAFSHHADALSGAPDTSLKWGHHQIAKVTRTLSVTIDGIEECLEDLRCQVSMDHGVYVDDVQSVRRLLLNYRHREPVAAQRIFPLGDAEERN